MKANHLRWFVHVPDSVSKPVRKIKIELSEF